MHFYNFKTNQVYHIVFQVFVGILKAEDNLKRKLILDEICILYKLVYILKPYGEVLRIHVLPKKNTLSARPYIESVFFLRIHSNVNRTEDVLSKSIHLGVNRYTLLSK